MSMLLTIAQPPRTDFGGRISHDFSPRIPLAKSRLSPQPKVDSPVSSLRVSATSDHKMSTPHRGLPPPSAMTLPDPGRPHQIFQPSSNTLPNAPSPFDNHGESYKAWMAAKAEEEKRKQEEERTRQEVNRLEQRRLEQSMLREALQAGVPPAAIPLIYAGIEWLQQYAGQMQANQHQVLQQQQSSPELRREPRLIGQVPPAYPITQPHQVVPSQHPEQSQQQPPAHSTFSAYQPGPPRPPPTSAPRSATHTSLPRLTTADIYNQQPNQHQGPSSAHPLQQSQTISQDHPTSSPSIYFHHWVPPNESKSTQPPTPASRGEPMSAHPGSHLSESDYKESPRKRKAQGPHQPAPPPSAGPQYTSPSFSNASSTSRKKTSHHRSGSNASAREGDSRPDNRRDREPRRSTQPESRHSSAEERRPPEQPSLPAEESSGRMSTDPQPEHRLDRPQSRGAR
ncbi:hypothetical protein LTR09_006247 [Extremus antarcticus]|uniref:Uncharacterized protein n=1 Tax=Extremus antarcticus TaxID=702011 RepID=A0AAJ0G825_9PEZI|nr:hypothetical protein LTR09_006247 [Extremus antarcticus]